MRTPTAKEIHVLRNVIQGLMGDIEGLEALRTQGTKALEVGSQPSLSAILGTLEVNSTVLQNIHKRLRDETP